MMKKIYFSIVNIFLALCALFVGCSEDTILEKDSSVFAHNDIEFHLGGQIFDEYGRKKMDLKSISDLWEDEFTKSGSNHKIGKFTLLNIENENGNAFFLKGTSIDGTLETGAYLLRDSKIDSNNDRNKKINFFRLGKRTCSCEGCSQGCSLFVFPNSCGCTPCPPHQAGCIKSESIVIEE